jgi:hypothetical protein
VWSSLGILFIGNDAALVDAARCGNHKLRALKHSMIKI